MAHDGVHFKNTDNARWGAGDGAGPGGRLTSLQVDDNFWEVLTRVENMENNPPQAVSITNITVQGSQAILNMSDGSHIGPFDLPLATFRMLGQWVNDFPYLRLDIFTVDGLGLYMVLIPHTSPASPAAFDPEAIDEDSGSPTFGQPLYQLLFGTEDSIYDAGFFFPGAPGRGVDSDDWMFAHTFTREVSLAIGAPDSKVELRVAPTSDMTLTLKKNGTTIGTATIESGTLTGTFTVASGVDFAVGDTFAVPPPAGDATAKSLTLTMRFIRQDI
jgi:hypothetical protein